MACRERSQLLRDRVARPARPIDPRGPRLRPPSGPGRLRARRPSRWPRVAARGERGRSCGYPPFASPVAWPSRSIARLSTAHTHSLRTLLTRTRTPNGSPILRQHQYQLGQLDPTAQPVRAIPQDVQREDGDRIRQNLLRKHEEHGFRDRLTARGQGQDRTGQLVRPDLPNLPPICPTNCHTEWVFRGVTFNSPPR